MPILSASDIFTRTFVQGSNFAELLQHPEVVYEWLRNQAAHAQGRAIINYGLVTLVNPLGTPCEMWMACLFPDLQGVLDRKQFVFSGQYKVSIRLIEPPSKRMGTEEVCRGEMPNRNCRALSL